MPINSFSLSLLPFPPQLESSFTIRAGTKEGVVTNALKLLLPESSWGEDTERNVVAIQIERFPLLR